MSIEEHYAARVEVYVDHVLVCKGWRIQRHPKIAGVSTRPDFRVWHPGGRFMIEVKASLEAETLRKYEEAVLELVDALADIRTHFYIHMEPVSRISRSISKRRIRKFLERELAKLDPNKHTKETLLRYVDGNVVIDFQILSTVQPQEGNGIFSWPAALGGVSEITTYERIRSAADSKLARYGKLKEPYLLVLWPHSIAGSSGFQIERALFGDYKIEFRLNNGVVVQTGDRRSLNGVFTRHQDGFPIATRLSAIAIYEHTAVGRESNRFNLVIYHNPYAAYPLDPSLFGEFPQMVPHRQADDIIELAWIGGQPSWNDM